MSIRGPARACSGSRPMDGSLCLLQILLSMLGVSVSEHCTYYVDGKVPKPEKSPQNGWFRYFVWHIIHQTCLIFWGFIPPQSHKQRSPLLPSHRDQAWAPKLLLGSLLDLHILPSPCPSLLYGPGISFSFLHWVLCPAQPSHPPRHSHWARGIWQEQEVTGNRRRQEVALEVKKTSSVYPKAS